MKYSIDSIGVLRADENGFYVELEKQYAEGLIGLEGFEYVQVIWWFSGCDNAESRAVRVIDSPYVKGPEKLGVFATRSPERPNPIAVSPSRVTGIDAEHGIIHLEWSDAANGSPVLDIKPYQPSADRVESPSMPDWCAHWPKSIEASGDFDWGAEFNF